MVQAGICQPQQAAGASQGRSRAPVCKLRPSARRPSARRHTILTASSDRRGGQLQADQSQGEHDQQLAASASDQLDGRSSSGGASAAGERAVAQPAFLPLGPLGLAACAVAAVPLLLPQAAAASSVLATLVPHSLHQHHYSDTLWWGCVALGAASLLTTTVCTSRFLVSLWPGLEREVEQRRWRLPYVAVTLYDPLLQPMRRRFFRQTEEGDLDYAAVALLAVVTSLLEILVGKDGLLNDSIPDFALLHALQWLILLMHGQLLPAWVIVVLRWGHVL